MKNFFKKFKIDPKNIALVAGVFLAVYAILYYRTNWNTQPVFEQSANKVESSFAGSIDTKSDMDSDGDGLSNDLEYIHGTDPKNSDSDGDGFGDKQEITNGYDPTAPGDARPAVELSISKIAVTAPMVWSKSENEKDQLADLTNGVAHFPKTASPGQSGNMIVSGHSSNYVWAKGSYNYIFKNLNNLMPGDTVDFKTVQQNGKIITYHYKISEKFTTVPNDERIFEDTGGATLTLSTCWPLRSNLRRLIVKADMVQ